MPDGRRERRFSSDLAKRRCMRTTVLDVSHAASQQKERLS